MNGSISTKMKPTPEQWRIFRYLAVGGWNTLFGLGVYALLYRWWGNRVNYLLLAVPANILAISNAFLCYKLLVFRTRGNWWREYFRCCIVYGGGALVGMGLLKLFVEYLHWIPDLANVAGTGIVVAGSYLGHRFYSFRSRE